MSWQNTGFDAAKKERERLARLNGPPEFWVPVGQQKSIVFIDDSLFSCHRHTIKKGERFESFTCLDGSGEAPICCEQLGPRSRVFVGYVTIVDCSEYTDRAGNSHQYELKLLPAKLTVVQKLQRKKEERSSLVGCMFTVARDNDKEPACGSDFSFTRDTDLTKLFAAANYRGSKLSVIYEKAKTDASAMKLLKETFLVGFDDKNVLQNRIAPFNYDELLKPDVAQVKAVLAGYRPSPRPNGGGNGGGGAKAQDDEIPF